MRGNNLSDKFNINDKVRHKAEKGGPVMLVDASDGDDVTCSWREKGKKMSAAFKCGELEKVGAPGMIMSVGRMPPGI